MTPAIAILLVVLLISNLTHVWLHVEKRDARVRQSRDGVVHGHDSYTRHVRPVDAPQAPDRPESIQ